jgi:hypothetical protein
MSKSSGSHRCMISNFLAGNIYYLPIVFVNGKNQDRRIPF